VDSNRSPLSPVAPKTRWNVGSVSFLNAKPLIEGLDADPRVRLHLEVPSRLLDRLADRRCDVALLPVIDYQRLAGLRLIPAGGIGCDGPTLTVRIFSRSPLDRIDTLLCDTDSHTSVALARVILAERYGRRPAFVDLSADVAGAAGRAPAPAADLPRLLIGDKVITDEPADCPHQLDLGQAWKELTGLPFVFATWMARADADLGDLPALLAAARVRGLAAVEWIVAEHAPRHGWPLPIARQYLTEYLQFEVGEPQLEAIRLFHRLAAKHGVLEHEPWDLRIVQG
jgi:chorismate dehydratase